MEFIQESDRSKWKAQSNHSIKCFTKGDIDRMTNSYQTSLGRGAFAEVYEGVLEDGSMVAVKRFIHNVKENFAKELIVHREINHKNIVRLIGCCEEENALMLVTEYIANGNLNDLLHDGNLPIPLDVRLRIAIECAEALAYMHSHMYTQVIHGDIKPGNILLDSNFHAKLSDFGISRLVNTDKTLHTKNFIGSIGYMDPLFSSDGLLTVKSDVYSFGVVLIELMTRKKAVVDNINMVYAFTSALARGSRGVRGMFDAEIASKDNMEVVEGVAKIAGECLTKERERCPEMTDVVERLRVLRQKASHQYQASQHTGLLSWVRKNKLAPPANIPASILPSDLLVRQFSFADIKAATNNFAENALMLVTEYVANGNLSDLLRDDNLPIPLDVRLRIAIECAEALAYMHSHMYTQVIHGDVKPGNILLDSNFHAKLSDFGISRLANTDKTLHTKNVIGSIGYMDPLFALDGRLTVKYDVYSFGVVLLELMARKKATTVVDNVSIVYAFTSALARGSGGVRWMFDAEIIASKDNMKVVEGVAKIAGECLTIEREKRPEMIDVVERLRVLRQKASRQDQASQRSGLFSWARKNKTAPPASANTPANILPSDLLLRQFLFADIKAATNNFDGSLHVGAGLYSNVYRGMIYGAGTKVAIKRLRLDHSWSISNEFYNEIQMMSKLRHCPHLVPLLGYCAEKGEITLVYDYMDRGSLLEHVGTQKAPALTWKQRIEICITAARGLRYLHELQIIHGNVKSSNILLNEKWVAKITDLSVCSTELLRHLTVIHGPIGYLDPEYMVTGRMTEKSDVYSLGAVLFEVLCDRCAFDYKLPDEQKALTRWALRCKEEGNLDQIIDPYLMGRINPLSLDKFAETAEKCVALQGIDRPSMGDVVSDLECALQLQVNAEATGGLAGGSMSNGAMDRGCGWYRFR